MKLQTNILMLIAFGLSISIFWSSCDPDEPTPIPLPCDVLFPSTGTVVDTSIFYFEWCAEDNVTSYRVQASNNFISGDIIFDTIVEGTTVKSTMIYQSTADPALFVEGTPFFWGNTYEWRYTTVINGVEGEWSEVYEFQTWDARDKYVGTFTINKYKYLTNRWYNSSLDTFYGLSQIKIEKVPDSRSILFTELGGDNLTKELHYGFYGTLWEHTDNVYPNYAKFGMQNDSFEVVIMTNPADDPPHGFYFGGFQ